MNDVHISDIGDRLLTAVTRILREFDGVASPEMLARANLEIKATYDELDAAGRIQIAFEGCRIVGGAACVVLDQMRIVPVTAFHPQARFLHDDREAIALGFCGEFDLYFQTQGGGLPPTLVARYGDQGSDYTSLNPTFTRLSDVGHESRAIFGEALRRAKALALVR
ncbi:hypothetical protein QYH69_32440 [Paraburkholderia sp. SARCC-3016]|uniref:hypothetical protein n=1 Tax=Paraburkholderia sp. SARCC-3016 TaxID=3058611 RepID=UPI002806B27E|nr:hypothetical protein [Paraburkholderia sp. SARCC-3016]MDQ7981934.1 hypothetical protein [Paraburkholderia sp. SARCC-3016]